MPDTIAIAVTETVDTIALTVQEGVQAPVLFGTGSPPSAVGLADGTIYFQIT